MILLSIGAGGDVNGLQLHLPILLPYPPPVVGLQDPDQSSRLSPLGLERKALSLLFSSSISSFWSADGKWEEAKEDEYERTRARSGCQSSRRQPRGDHCRCVLAGGGGGNGQRWIGERWVHALGLSSLPGERGRLKGDW